MKWNPDSMLMYDVYKPFGSLEKAGLKAIGRKQKALILTFSDDSKQIVLPDENIPLDYERLLAEKGASQ